MSSLRWRRVRVGGDADEMPVESHGAVDVRSLPTSKGEGRDAGLGSFHLQALEQRIQVVGVLLFVGQDLL